MFRYKFSLELFKCENVCVWLSLNKHNAEEGVGADGCKKKFL